MGNDPVRWNPCANEDQNRRNHGRWFTTFSTYFLVSRLQVDSSNLSPYFSSRSDTYAKKKKKTNLCVNLLGRTRSSYTTVNMDFQDPKIHQIYITRTIRSLICKFKISKLWFRLSRDLYEWSLKPLVSLLRPKLFIEGQWDWGPSSDGPASL